MNSKTITRNMALVLSLLAALLAGCRRDYDEPTLPQGQPEDHRASFAGGETLRLPVSATAPSWSPSDSGEVQYYVDEKGNKIPKSYYIVYCDIFYKLDWIRSQLRKHIVPPEFGSKLKNVRKELELATTGITHDGNYKVADEALKLLEHGLQHYLAEGELAASGAQVSSAPWSLGKGAMQRYIDAGALGFGAKSIANTMPDPGPDTGTDLSRPDASLEIDTGGTSKALTRRQRTAIAIALQYTTDYGRSPHECAESDWSKAAVKINTLGDQLYLIKTGANRDNGSTVAIAPNSGSDTNVGVFNDSGVTGRRNGADLPGVPAPTGDPFLTTSPNMRSPGQTPGGASTP